MERRISEAIDDTIYSPVFEPSDFDEVRKTKLHGFARNLVNEFNTRCSVLSKENYPSVAEQLHERMIKNERGLSISNLSPEARVAVALNKMLGGFLSDFMNSYRILRNSDRHDWMVCQQACIDSARYQAEAIIALGSLSELKTKTDYSDTGLLESFWNIAHRTMKIEFDGDNKQAKNGLGIMLSGIYGPVATSMLLQKQGYDVWLTEPEVDVSHKADLAFGKGHSRESLPNRIFLTQVKTLRGEHDEIRFSENPKGLSTKEQEDWNRLKNYVSALNSSSIYRDAGIDFSPGWVKVYHVGLSEPDDWFAGLMAIEEQEVLYDED